MAKRKKSKRSKASYSRAAKLGWARRKRRGGAKKKTTKRKKKSTAKRKPVQRNPGRRTAKGRYAKKGRVVRRVRLKSKPGSKRRQRYAIVARKRKRSYKYRVRHNVGTVLKQTFKDMGSLFLGILGVRALTQLFSTHVVNKHVSTTNTTLTKLLPLAAPGAMLLASAVYRKKKPSKMSANLVQAAMLGFFDASLQAIVKLAQGTATTAPTWSAYLLPSPLSEYIASPGYGEYIAQPGYGVDVQEAMAEYVADPGQQLTMGGMGLDVEEALADDEIRGMQSGYAGGSMAHSVFSTL